MCGQPSAVVSENQSQWASLVFNSCHPKASQFACIIVYSHSVCYQAFPCPAQSLVWHEHMCTHPSFVSSSFSFLRANRPWDGHCVPTQPPLPGIQTEDEQQCPGRKGEDRRTLHVSTSLLSSACLSSFLSPLSSTVIIKPALPLLTCRVTQHWWLTGV